MMRFTSIQAAVIGKGEDTKTDIVCRVSSLRDKLRHFTCEDTFQ